MSNQMNIRPAMFIDALRIAEIHNDTLRAAYKQILPIKFLAEPSIDSHKQKWESRLGVAFLKFGCRKDSIITVRCIGSLKGR